MRADDNAPWRPMESAGTPQIRPVWAKMRPGFAAGHLQCPTTGRSEVQVGNSLHSSAPCVSSCAAPVPRLVPVDDAALMTENLGHEGPGVATAGGGGWGAGDCGDCGDFIDGEEEGELGGGHDDGDEGPVHYGHTVRGQVPSHDAAPMSAEWGNHGLGGVGGGGSGGGGWDASSVWGAGDFVDGDEGRGSHSFTFQLNLSRV